MKKEKGSNDKERKGNKKTRDLKKKHGEEMNLVKLEKSELDEETGWMKP